MNISKYECEYECVGATINHTIIQGKLDESENDESEMVMNMKEQCMVVDKKKNIKHPQITLIITYTS